jgi:hypothetical protein
MDEDTDRDIEPLDEPADYEPPRIEDVTDGTGPLSVAPMVRPLSI